MANAINLKKERVKLLNRMKKETHFKEQFECENLAKKWEEASEKGVLTRNHFREFCFKNFFLTDDVMLDRVFKAFDLDNDGHISLEEWCKGLSVCLRGTQREKARMCFDVYDMNNDGYITREEMFQLLKNSFIASKSVAEEDPDEGIRDLVDLALKLNKTDSQDPRISLLDFEEAVEKDGLLLEVFGQCLPSPKCVEELEETICHSHARGPRFPYVPKNKRNADNKGSPYTYCKQHHK